MPVTRCRCPDGRPGHRWGESGTCYCGTRSRQRAEEQGRAIRASGYRADAWDIDQSGAPSARPLIHLVRSYMARLDRWAGSRLALAKREYRDTRLDAWSADEAARIAVLVQQYVVDALTLPADAGGPPPPPDAARVERIGGPAADQSIRAQRRAMLRAGMPRDLMAVRLGLVEFDPGDPESLGMLTGVQLVRSAAERELVTAWARDAASYIRTLPVDYADEVAIKVANAVEEGWTWQVVRDQVRASGVSTQARAELIARDQTAKLNSAITESMHAAAGVTHYRWRAVGDAATRPEHMAADGEVIAWSSAGWPGAGFYGEPAHAGEGGQCRCVAIPIPPPEWSADR